MVQSILPVAAIPSLTLSIYGSLMSTKVIIAFCLFRSKEANFVSMMISPKMATSRTNAFSSFMIISLHYLSRGETRREGERIREREREREVKKGRGIERAKREMERKRARRRKILSEIVPEIN